jgi:acetolactate synthase-1/2/3 large subunit
MIFVGGGALHAGEEVQELAEMLQAPIIPGRNGRGVVSNDHYLSLTGPGGYDLWPDCDVALAVGSRMYIPLARWGFDDKIKIIRLDVDSDNLDNIAPTEVAVIGDSKESLRKLISVLSRTMTPKPSRKAEIEAHRAKMDAVFRTLQPQYDFVQAIRAALPEDGIFIDEVTQIGFVARVAMPVHHPRSYISTGYQGTLGFGFPTALGVKVAFPDRPVLNVSGDGGFMYNVQELSTAVCHNIALVTVVFADNAFGNVKRMQQRRYGGREIASDLHNPDFVRLAESFGVTAARVHTPSELEKAIRQGFEHHGPTLIEVPVGEMPSPWEITYPSANRGT